MKTKNSIILVSVIFIVSLFLLSLYIPAYLQCSEGLQWDLSCSFPERTVSFEKFVKQKATRAFEMTLEKYGINSEQITVQDGFRWNNEFFMAESIADDDNRYYLMAVFAHNVPVGKIDVQIFKIISEKCTTEHIQNKQGCAPEYIQELKIPGPKTVTSSVSIDPPSGLSQEERKQLQIKKILDQCNIDGVTINILYKFSNSTHYIDSKVCEWQKDSVLTDILDRCEQIKRTGTFGGFAYGASWQNDTHSIDNNSCKWEIRK